MNRMDREEHLYTAFQYFDKDNSGYVQTTLPNILFQDTILQLNWKLKTKRME